MHYTLQGHSNGVASVAYSPDGNYLASGSQDKTVKLWSCSAGYREITTLRGHKNYVCCVAFSKDNIYLASGSEDNTVKLWNV